MQSSAFLEKAWMKRRQSNTLGVKQKARGGWLTLPCSEFGSGLNSLRIRQGVDIIFVRFFLFSLHRTLFYSYFHQHACKHNGVQNSIFVPSWCQILYLHNFHYFSSEHTKEGETDAAKIISDAGGPAVTASYSTASVRNYTTGHTGGSARDVTQKNSELTAKTCFQKLCPHPLLLLRCTFCSSWLCRTLLPLPLFAQSQTQPYSPVWRGFSLPGPWWVTGLTSTFADFYLWHHYFFDNTFLKRESVRDQAVIYSSVHTGVEQVKYRDGRTSPCMSSSEIRGWLLLNHSFKKVSTWHCYQFYSFLPGLF